MDIYLNLKASAERAKKALESAARSTSKLGRETKATNSGMATFFNTLKKTNSKFTNIAKDVNRASASLTGFGKALKGVTTIAGIYGLVNVLKTAIQSAMDMVETENLFNISLQENAKSAEKFLKNMSAATGMDITNLKSATGTFALLARSMGMSGDQAERLSTTSTQLAIDLASAVNVPVSQAMQDIKSGLIGQTETMYKYGVDLTEAALKQEAMADGIKKSVRTMSQGEKMALRYNLMLKQTAIVHGDFAKTIETPANQMKVLSERVVTAGRAIGTIFLPAIKFLLPFANAAVIVITNLANAIAKLFGYNPDDYAQTGVGAISEDAEAASGSIDDTNKALKKLKDTALGFDELNTIQTATDSDDAVATGASAIQGMDLSTYDAGFSGLTSKADGYAQQIIDAFNNKDWAGIGRTIASGVNSFVEYFNLSGIFTKIDAFGVELGFALGTVINNGVAGINWANMAATIGTGINTFINFVLNLIGTIDFIRIGGAFSTFMNNALSTINWTTAGQYVMLGFNTLVDFLYGAIISFDFKNLGNSIATFINGAAGSVNWKRVGEILSEGVSGLFTTLSTALAGIDWIALGEDVAEFFSGIDWLSILGSVGTAILEAFKGVVDFLMGMFGEELLALTLIVGGFFAAWKLAGMVQFVVEAGSVGKALKSLTGGFGGNTKAMIEDRIAAMQLAGEYISNLVKSLLASIGQIASATGAWIANTAATIGNKIAIMASTVAQWAMVAATTAWNAITVVATAVTTAFGAAVAFLTSPIGIVILAIAALVAGIVLLIKNWDSVKETMQNVWNKIVEVWGKVNGWFREHVTEPLATLFKGMANEVMGFFEGMINGVINGLNWFIKKVNTVLALINEAADVLGFSIDLHFNTIEPVMLPRLARGGVLSRGTLFEAGENGKAEMLGNYNGNTTVMPLENTDFVQAMYEAVASAMKDTQENGGQVVETIVNLDGEVIYRNQKRVEQNRGQNFGLGAFAR